MPRLPQRPRKRLIAAGIAAIAGGLIAGGLARHEVNQVRAEAKASFKQADLAKEKGERELYKIKRAKESDDENWLYNKLRTLTDRASKARNPILFKFKPEFYFGNKVNLRHRGVLRSIRQGNTLFNSHLVKFLTSNEEEIVKARGNLLEWMNSEDERLRTWDADAKKFLPPDWWQSYAGMQRRINEIKHVLYKIPRHPTIDRSNGPVKYFTTDRQYGMPLMEYRRQALVDRMFEAEADQEKWMTDHIRGLIVELQAQGKL